MGTSLCLIIARHAGPPSQNHQKAVLPQWKPSYSSTQPLVSCLLHMDTVRHRDEDSKIVTYTAIF